MEEFYTTNVIESLPKKYVIFDYNEVYKINFNDVLETSIDSLRLSIDGKKTFVKYQGNMPNSIQILFSKSQEYTYEEILTILNTSEWYIPVTEN